MMMDSKGVLKATHKKKKSETGIPKAFRAEGIPRIPKTFVFDQNLPKEEYLKYISPENIIPESLEVATKIFSNYRKSGISKVGRLNKMEVPQILKHKASLPFFDHPKNLMKESSTHRDGFASYEASVIQEMKQSSRKKTGEKFRHDEVIQDSMVDLKGIFKDIASFSTNQDHKNLEHIDGQQGSLQKARSSLKNGEESVNQSKVLHILNASTKLKSQDKEGMIIGEQTLAKENNQKHQHKNSEGDLIHKLAQKKKKAHEEHYQISDLDNTQEIVRKTEVAVKTLSKRSELVKREMKNIEETVKAQLKETETVPITSLRAVSLVRDYVFNEEEFAKLIEEEDMEEEREKAQREYNQRKKRKEKKRTNSSKQVESKLKVFSGAMSARLDHVSIKKTSPKKEIIIITKEEKNQVDEVVKKIVAEKEEELQKQIDVQMRIHEKYGVFSNDNNLFRINTMNYTKLVREREKIREHLMKELKNTKYKEREASAPTHRMRTIQSDRSPQYELDQNKNEEKGSEGTSKEDAKQSHIDRIKEVLTKPVKENTGNKLTDYATHAKRLEGLRKKNTTTDIERVNQITYHNL